ncbi:hypothetical protein ACET85_05540 [Aeromonas veronii]|uniref:hypothetical protein n=1 Tax=Aeromonas veronii TaxID=654 RepID=UPI0027DBE5D9|nr:hypothetical protein [Aeromonas veronii]WMJ05162.1 hypothetical protein RBH93_00475 [Aeromonas veronii]
MKKNVLALSVVTALSSLALAGCGGGGDGASTDNGNNGGNGGNATKPALTATFIDSAVAGLNYTCGSYSSLTDKDGQFFFNDGDTCTFKLGSIPLGETLLKKGQNLVTPYTIAKNGDKKHAIRIAALLQTMDDDNNPANGITLKPDDIAKLGNTIRFESDDAFNTSLNETLKQAQIENKVVVGIKEAEAHMNDSLAVINGLSVAVDKVLRSLLEESQDWQKTNFESKLREYKDILNAETGDQGKADREVVKSVITLMEITNDPIVSNRFDIQPPSALGQGYQTSLAKILDIIVNPFEMLSFNIKEQPAQTEDISRLMGKYALELENISNTLANIVKPDYLAKYGDDKLTLNFSQVQELRATALAMSSAMNVISAYQYGSASQFKVSQENVTFDKFTAVTQWRPYPEQSTTTYVFDKHTINTEYLNVNIHPSELFNDQLFFTFTKDHKTQLSKAKSQLQESIAIALSTDITDKADIDRAELINLQKHLNGTQNSIELNERVMIGDKYDDGYYADAIYTINLNPFFSLGLDRNDVILTIKESCKHKNYDVIGDYDETLSKAMDTAMCSISQSDVKAIYSPYYNDNFEYLGSSEVINPDTGILERHPTFAQGFPMRWFVELKAKQNSSFGKIFTSCKIKKEHENQDQWQPMPCDDLVSHSLSD